METSTQCRRAVDLGMNLDLKRTSCAKTVAQPLRNGRDLFAQRSDVVQDLFPHTPSALGTARASSHPKGIVTDHGRCRGSFSVVDARNYDGDEQGCFIQLCGHAA